MEQDKWIQQLRDKLDGYEADVPEGLWEGIETTLQKQNVLPVSPVVPVAPVSYTCGDGLWRHRWWSASLEADTGGGASKTNLKILSPKK